MKIIDAGAIDALVASGRVEEAVAGLIETSQQQPTEIWPLRRLGQLLAARGQVNEAYIALQRALAIDPHDIESLWGAYELEQVAGNTDAALAVQARAIAIAPVLACRSLLQDPPGRMSLPLAKKCRVLMLCVPGTYQANNPLEYIVDGASIELYKWFLTGSATPELPQYDVVFNAIGYAHGVEAALRQAQAFISGQDKPCLNAPEAIVLTSRSAVTQKFSDSRHVTAAPTIRMSRTSVAQLSVREPILLRPLNSQAGDNFCKISYDGELVAYLASVSDVMEFYQSPFIEYAGRDGLYRKYRIAYIDGVPYPVHLAISPNWMVHYYNSAMSEHRWMREEEAIFMRDINEVFTGIAATGLREIARSFPLDYFAIDCSIAADGRVLLFEADTAMIVHMGDPIEMYPYKHQYIPRIVDALDRMFSRASAQVLTPQ